MKTAPPGRIQGPHARAQFSPATGPPRYSKKATVALLGAERPLYSLPAPLDFRVGRKYRARTIRRARTLRRDEYIALSAQILAPKRELNATKFRHSAALPISADVYFGDM